MRDSPVIANSSGLLLFVKLTPNAPRDEVLGIMEGVDGPLIVTKVRAIADKGKANKALMALSADWLGLAKSAISLKSGSKSRLKTLLIKGNAQEIEQTLRVALASLAQQE